LSPEKRRLCYWGGSLDVAPSGEKHISIAQYETAEPRSNSSRGEGKIHWVRGTTPMLVMQRSAIKRKRGSEELLRNSQGKQA